MIKYFSSIINIPHILVSLQLISNLFFFLFCSISVSIRHERNVSFNQFVLSVQLKENDTDGGSPLDVGRFQIHRDTKAIFDPDCLNTVAEIDRSPKTEAVVSWKAPNPGNQCVLFRYESVVMFFMRMELSKNKLNGCWPCRLFCNLNEHPNCISKLMCSALSRNRLVSLF